MNDSQMNKIAAACERLIVDTRRGVAANTSTATTAATNSTPLPTLDELQAAINQIPPIDTDWILASPDGRMWKGDIAKLFSILAQHHPLMKPGGFL